MVDQQLNKSVKTWKLFLCGLLRHPGLEYQDGLYRCKHCGLKNTRNWWMRYGL